MSAPQMTLSGGTMPAEHPAYPRLTTDQQCAVNEVWDDTVIPALAEADAIRREAHETLLRAQDSADGLRLQIRDLRYELEQARSEAARLRWEATS